MARSGAPAAADLAAELGRLDAELAAAAAAPLLHKGEACERAAGTARDILAALVGRVAELERALAALQGARKGAKR